MIIATQNRYLEVAILLLDRNANRWAALSVAAKNGQVDVTRVLPDWKANASATDIQQQATLLMFVSKNGRVDLASPLLNPNVEVDVNLMNQWTVLMSSEFACENGHADVATLLLDVTSMDGVTDRAIAPQMAATENDHITWASQMCFLIGILIGMLQYKCTRNDSIHPFSSTASVLGRFAHAVGG